MPRELIFATHPSTVVLQLKAKDESGKSALMWAAYSGQADVAALLETAPVLHTSRPHIATCGRALAPSGDGSAIGNRPEPALAARISSSKYLILH